MIFQYYHHYRAKCLCSKCYVSANKNIGCPVYAGKSAEEIVVKSRTRNDVTNNDGGTAAAGEQTLTSLRKHLLLQLIIISKTLLLMEV